jgi:hypothetical protein
MFFDVVRTQFEIPCHDGRCARLAGPSQPLFVRSVSSCCQHDLGEDDLNEIGSLVALLDVVRVPRDLPIAGLEE